MSFSFAFTGAPSVLADKLDDEVAKAMYGDTSQVEAVKAFIAGELAAMPETVTGVHVEANGHHDGYQRTVNIKIQPVRLIT
jgi:hypothetical protein